MTDPADAASGDSPYPQVQLVALWALGVGLPFLAVAGELGLYFDLYQADLVDFAVLLFLIAVLPPLGVYALMRRLPAGPRVRGHRVLVGCLFVAAARQLTGPVPGPLGWLVPVAVLLAGLPGWWRVPARRWSGALVVAAAGAALLYQCARSPLAPKLIRSKALPPAGPGLAEDRPVFLLVFDELPLYYLLDCDGEIDRETFPHFAALAAGADWYPRATTVHPFTKSAVPALLSARAADRHLEANTENFPGNLFQLFAATHRMVSFEHLTSLSPPRSRDPGSPWARRPGRMRAMLADLGVALPRLLKGGGAAEMTELAGELQAFQGEGEDGGGGDSRMRRFLAAIDGARPRTLHYFHSWLPHSPLTFLEDGALYPAFHLDMIDVEPAGPGERFVRYFWAKDPDVVTNALQRSMIQMRYVDRQLGEFVGRLKAEGLYDRALIVVTSDHGNRSQAGAQMRGFVDEKGAVVPGAAEEILQIPLFIKRPGQSRGRVREAPVRTIDIVPSIAAEVGIPVPWPHEGRPFGTNPDPSAPVVFWDAAHRRHARVLDWDAARRKACWIRGKCDPPAGARPADWMYYLRPYGAAVGLAQGDLRLRGVGEGFRFGWDGWGTRGRLRVLVGSLQRDGDPLTSALHLAFFAEGRVIAVAPAIPQPGGDLRFVAMVAPGVAPRVGAEVLVGALAHGPEGLGYQLIADKLSDKKRARPGGPVLPGGGGSSGGR